VNQIRKRLTYANLVATLALFLALAGGTAFAASQLAKNSVGSKQLKKEAVTASKIKSGAVTASKINPTGLTVPNATHATTADTATSATSATKATNAVSATNATTAGTATALGTVFYRNSAAITSPVCSTSPCSSPSDTPGVETCPTGTMVVGGGIHTSGAGLELNEGEPIASVSGGSLDEWHVFVDNFTSTARTFTVWAICVKANTANTE
jgi:hypothetical protein